MHNAVSKTFLPVDSNEQPHAAYAAIQLSIDEAKAVVQPAPKPAQQ